MSMDVASIIHSITLYALPLILAIIPPKYLVVLASCSER